MVSTITSAPTTASTIVRHPSEAMFSSSTDEKVTKEINHALTSTVIQLIANIAQLKETCEAVTSLFKSSLPNLGNMAPANKFMNDFKKQTEGLYENLGHMFHVKTLIDRNQTLLEKTGQGKESRLDSLVAEDQYDDPDIPFSKKYFTPLHKLHHVYRAKSLVDYAKGWPSLDDDEVREVVRLRNSSRAETDRIMKKFESSKAYEEGSDRERAQYERFKAEITNLTEVGSTDDFVARARRYK